MADTVCIVCGQTGGRFRFVGEGKWAHTRTCTHENIVINAGKNLWEFDTGNITKTAGETIHVNSLHHLRQLEKQYGVQSVAANMDSNNWER